MAYYRRGGFRRRRYGFRSRFRRFRTRFRTRYRTVFRTRYRTRYKTVRSRRRGAPLRSSRRYTFGDWIWKLGIFALLICGGIYVWNKWLKDKIIKK